MQEALSKYSLVQLARTDLINRGKSFQNCVLCAISDSSGFRLELVPL